MKATKHSQSGFTLLELMIVVAIVAILSTIAYASYQDQIVRSRRAAAAVCLQQAAQFVERYYSTSMTYVGAGNPPACDADVAAHYSAPTFTAAPTAKAFTLQIAPTGAQATKDTKCGTLSLNQAGARGKSGSAADASECW
ncbi:type IV pilin protein [Pseudoxanthomonas dokdonensis]|uniref:Pilus assembly protein PilE n=1 Tax=Pseudoxanthomonas dokdonensis TaxID=344882 RepID=A0A0R0CV35_9GAMM|nr:type IV pilin protein [Pseudoxanthomonas dokdonensis]KRG69155.1 pilus assembly protein PilE [Pseudoxanthomonas dokdonensis]